MDGCWRCDLDIHIVACFELAVDYNTLPYGAICFWTWNVICFNGCLICQHCGNLTHQQNTPNDLIRVKFVVIPPHFVQGIKTGSGIFLSQYRRACAKQDFDALFTQARMHCDNKRRQIGLNQDCNMTFSISPCELWMLVFSIWNTNMVLEGRAVSRATPIVSSRGALNDGNCHLTMPVSKGRCARDALPHTFVIGVFKTVKKNSNTIKHIYN